MRATNRFSMTMMAVLLVAGAACGKGADPQAEVPAETSAPQEEIAAVELPFRNAVMVDDALTGGQPTRDELAALAENGYRTVINMRMPQEDATSSEAAEALGMEYVSLPIDPRAGLTEEHAIAFAELLETIEGPVVVHCGSGNRVGAMYALKAFYVDGMSADEALAIGHEAGMTRLHKVVSKQLAEAEASTQ